MMLRKARPATPDCPPTFKLKQGDELLTDHAGLTLVGLALAKFAKVRGVFDAALPKRSGLSVGEIVTAYVALLCTGKSDFDAIENHRNDGLFAQALGISGTPAASTLRMQLDARAEQIIPDCPLGRAMMARRMVSRFAHGRRAHSRSQGEERGREDAARRPPGRAQAGKG